jgi:hypothetical protein
MMMEQHGMVVETASASANTGAASASRSTTAAAEATTTATTSTFVAAAATSTPMVEGPGATGARDQERCSGHDRQNQSLTKHQGSPCILEHLRRLYPENCTRPGCLHCQIRHGKLRKLYGVFRLWPSK